MHFNVTLTKVGETNKTIEVDAVDNRAAIASAESDHQGWRADASVPAFSSFYVTLARDGEYSRFTVQARDTSHAKTIAEAGWAGSEMIACSAGQPWR